jgi:class 3 adenylate cyclase
MPSTPRAVEGDTLDVDPDATADQRVRAGPSIGAPDADGPATGLESLSMATWMAIVVLAVTIVALVAGALVMTTPASDLADKTLRRRATALLAVQADEVARYLGRSRRQVEALAASGGVVEAARRLGEAYDELDDLPTGRVDVATRVLSDHYREAVVPPLVRVTGTPIPVARLLPDRGAARYLQRLYTVPDPAPEPPPREVVDARDGSRWSQVHAEVHPGLLEVVDRLGLQDLYLVDPAGGTVVYSTGKAPDFATSLVAGPWSGSVLAQAVRDVIEGRVDDVVVTDLAPHGPYEGQPTTFVVAPVRDGDRLVAVLAAALASDGLDRIMTGDRQWMDVGFGRTGETFLVGADGRMRTLARSFAEDPEAYLETVRAAGSASPTERGAMAATGTTATFQRAVGAGDLATAEASDEPVEWTDWLGRDMIATVARLDAAGLDWRVVTQVEAAEVAAPVAGFRAGTLAVVAVLVAVVTLGMLPWTRHVFAPLRAASERLARTHRREPTGSIVLPRRAAAEFAELADAVDGMILSQQRRQAEIEAAIAERRETLTALLPPAIARRVEAGDRRVVEEVPLASVVVLHVDGVERVLRTADGPPELIGVIVSALDALADRHGLVRIKLFGDLYYAGCGLDRPVLDHAPRAVAFALEAQAAVDDLAHESVDLTVSGAIASGTVTVGLAGSVLLVYDAWGGTVEAAERLASAARAGQLLVSDRTRSMLPEETSTVSSDAGDGAWRVVTDPGRTE